MSEASQHSTSNSVGAFETAMSLWKNFFVKARSFCRDESGLETIEWFLLLGAGIVPLVFLIMKIMDMVAQYYSFTSWVYSLPFP